MLDIVIWIDVDMNGRLKIVRGNKRVASRTVSYHEVVVLNRHPALYCKFCAATDSPLKPHTRSLSRLVVLYRYVFYGTRSIEDKNTAAVATSARLPHCPHSTVITSAHCVLPT